MLVATRFLIQGADGLGFTALNVGHRLVVMR